MNGLWGNMCLDLGIVAGVNCGWQSRARRDVLVGLEGLDWCGTDSSHFDLKFYRYKVKSVLSRALFAIPIRLVQVL